MLLITLFLILCTVSCGQNGYIKEPEGDSTENPQSVPTEAPAQQQELISDYLPLKVGNLWLYEGEGNEYASFSQEIVYEQDGRYQMMTESGGTVMANVIEVRNDSLVNTYREGEVYDNKNILNKPSNLNIIIMKLPVEGGNSWESEENRYEILRTDAVVDVPAGKFDNCVEVGITFKDGSKGVAFYKKGVGLIQSDFIISETEIISSKLKSFSLK